MRALRAFAVVAALAVVCAPVSSARHRPPVHPVTVPRVSGAVPYVAPWQTGFEKFATQIVALNAAGYDKRTVVIPQGQWWRVIWQRVRLVAGAVAATRQLEYAVVDQAGQAVYEQMAATTQPALTTYNYVFGVGLTSYVSVANTNAGGVVQPLPDLLWPGGYTLEVFVNAGDPGDTFSGSQNMAVEVYTEDRPGVLTPFPTPQLA